MNEKIKELAEKAGFLLWEDEPWKPEGAIVDWGSQYDGELERFAELIINECLGICEELGDKGMDGHYCADKISKTFRS
jgi:hypothetical protein